jgi:tripartite-type tricarboxylate transporter receptor subunit TctC
MSWIGMVAPAGTPGPVMDKIWGATNTAMQEQTVRDILISGGSEVVMSTPAEFRQVIESDYAKYAKLADLLQAK